MRESSEKHDENARSAIWTVSGDDLVKFFVLYSIIYVAGAACVFWFQIVRDASAHEVVSGIITGVSLIGVGIAPSLALVLIESWRVTMIFSRALEQVLEERKLRKERERKQREEARKRRFINRGIVIGEKRGYEKGMRDALKKMRENGETSSSDRSTQATD